MQSAICANLILGMRIRLREQSAKEVMMAAQRYDKVGHESHDAEIIIFQPPFT